MAQPGDEIFVAVRTDAVVPVLVVGKGGADVERLDDVTIIPLPVDRKRIEAVVQDAAPVVEAIIAAADGLALLECNPVIVNSGGAVVVDATAQEVAT